MAKIKYHFNHETLSFETIQVGFKEILYKKILPHISISFVLGIALFVSAIFLIDSPFENKLKRVNSELLLNYELLNKRIEHGAKVLSEIEQRDNSIYRLMFEMSEIPTTMRSAGFGGSDRYVKLRGLENSDLLIETSKRLDMVSKKLVVQSKSFDEVISLVKSKEKMVASIPAIQPVAMKDLQRFGSPFGYRVHPILKYVRMHEGVDLTAKRGTKVYASGKGIVIIADNQGNGLGMHVRINHGYGYSTVYAHLSKSLVRSGQKVERGDVIGLVGSTGLSTGPHLHYEVRINNRPVNPLNFYYNDLSDEEYQKMVESSSEDTHLFEK